MEQCVEKVEGAERGRTWDRIEGGGIGENELPQHAHFQEGE